MEVPGYKIQRVLGEGGMATVYLAIQESLGREVALKVMSPELIRSDRTFCDRFVKEGKIIAKLRHQNIVTIYDIGCTGNDVYYMSMEYCGGGTLKEKLRNPAEIGDPIRILRQVASSLGYAHLKGFVHRDIKPGNVLFRDDGSAVLSDFGIAKTIDDKTQLTRVGFAIGTPEYMSPEQAIGADLDGRSDLYGLGVVLYEMLVGKKPFESNAAMATALMHIQNPVPRLPERLSHLQHILDRLMAKKPDERFSSAYELLDELDKLPEGGVTAVDDGSAPTVRIATSTSAGPAPTRVHTSVEPHKRRWWWAMIYIVPVVSLGTLGAWVWFGDAANVPPARIQSQNTGAETQGSQGVASGEGNASLSLEDREKLQRLLEVARMHLEVGRLREPLGSNALEAYSLALELDPGNREAIEGIARIKRMTAATR